MEEFQINPYLAGLKQWVEISPDDPALTDCKSGSSMSFHDFWRECSSVGIALTKRGVCTGDRVIVTAGCGTKYCLVIFGLFRIGAVPVFLDASMSTAYLQECITELSPVLWITDRTNEQLPNKIFIDALFELKTHSTGEHPALQKIHPVDDILIIYTSGTTGRPKGVRWSCMNVRSHLDVQREYYKDFELKSEFVLFPHLALSAIATGRRAVLPNLKEFQPNNIDMHSVVEQMEAYGADYIFGSPAFWRRFKSHCQEKSVQISGVKIAATAGAAVNWKTLQEASGVLPCAKIIIPYASTEALMPIAIIDLDGFSELRREGCNFARGIPIGVASYDMRVKTIPLRDHGPETRSSRPASEGAVGELVVTGPRVTRGYVGRPGLDEISKVEDSAGVIWHRTGDVGSVDADGMIWLLSRMKNVRLLDGDYIYPDQQEQLYNHYLGLDECAVVVARYPSMLFLVIPVRSNNKLVQSDVAEVALQNMLATPVILFYPANLPSDSRHNSKIDKAALEDWVNGLDLDEVNKQSLRGVN